MLELAFPWLLVLLPLPLLIRYFTPRLERQRQEIWLPLAASYSLNSQDQQQKLSIKLLPWFIWVCLVITATKPLWVGEPLPLPQKNRDMVLALDLSGSMQIEDMQLDGKQVDRLSLTKHVISEFVERRRGDRLGLILFADHAYQQAPLTYDLNTVQTLVEETEIGLVGDKTAIGEAIALGIKRFIEGGNKQKVMILLTDGQNTSGSIAPLKAAELAAEKQITIYTVGIGADEMIQRSLFGRYKVNPSADLDEKTLTEIARQTGGAYFRARDGDQLAQIYQELDKLEPVDNEGTSFRPEKNLFYWPLSLALLLSLTLFILHQPGRQGGI